MKRVLAVVAALGALAGLAVAWNSRVPLHAADGQAALVTLDAAAYAQMKERFNASANTTRIIALFSPT